MAKLSDTENPFLGTGWSFPPRFSKIKRGVELVSGEADIQESLRILLSTRVTERFLQPKYGCNLDELLFEPLNTTLKTYIRGLVKQAILRYEPRIEFEDVQIETLDEPAGKIELVVHYRVRATNSRYNLVFPFYRGEVSG
ncbi:MAG TPA: GPW/gp25 family protein [Malonomonas sp.]